MCSIKTDIQCYRRQNYKGHVQIKILLILNCILCINALFQPNSNNWSLWEHSHQKKGEIFFSLCKPPMLGIHRLMYIVEVLVRQKYLFQVLLHQNPYRHLNSIVLFLWTTRDQFHSRFPLQESIGCFMGVAIHTQQQNPMETNSTTSHDSFQKLDRNSGQDR